MAPLKPLVTAAWLGTMLHDETIRIADCRWYLGEPGRGREEYQSGHIPGARYFSLDDDLAAPAGAGRHPLPDPFEWREHLGGIGIGTEHTVIAYDDRGGAIAARLWWMLRSLGHGRVAVLDGGWTTWLADGRSVTTEEPRWPQTALAGSSRWSGIIDGETVANRLESLTLIDARAAVRYRGEAEPIDAVAGHIPTAYNAPYEDNLGPGQRFHSAHQLAARFSFLPRDSTAVSYCGSGVTACHNLLAMAIAGIDGSLLYPGSWSDWSAAGRAVARGSGR